MESGEVGESCVDGASAVKAGAVDDRTGRPRRMSAGTKMTAVDDDGLVVSAADATVMRVLFVRALKSTPLATQKVLRTLFCFSLVAGTVPMPAAVASDGSTPFQRRVTVCVYGELREMVTDVTESTVPRPSLARRSAYAAASAGSSGRGSGVSLRRSTCATRTRAWSLSVPAGEWSSGQTTKQLPRPSA